MPTLLTALIGYTWIVHVARVGALEKCSAFNDTPCGECCHDFVFGTGLPTCDDLPVRENKDHVEFLEKCWFCIMDITNTLCTEDQYSYDHYNYDQYTDDQYSDQYAPGHNSGPHLAPSPHTPPYDETADGSNEGSVEHTGCVGYCLDSYEPNDNPNESNCPPALLECVRQCDPRDVDMAQVNVQCQDSVTQTTFRPPCIFIPACVDATTPESHSPMPFPPNDCQVECFQNQVDCTYSENKLVLFEDVNMTTWMNKCFFDPLETMESSAHPPHGVPFDPCEHENCFNGVAVDPCGHEKCFRDCEPPESDDVDKALQTTLNNMCSCLYECFEELEPCTTPAFDSQIPVQLEQICSAPTTSDPTTGDPTTGNPTTDNPTTAQPTTTGPTTAQPTTTGPTTTGPTTTGPTTMGPTSNEKDSFYDGSWSWTLSGAHSQRASFTGITSLGALGLLLAIPV